MSCVASDALSELQFVQSLASRTKEHAECRGPVVVLSMTPDRYVELVSIFGSGVAEKVLACGFRDDDQEILNFSLCGAHWFDLACLVWVRAQQTSRSDWRFLANQLLSNTCAAAGWDAKEMVNMFAWRRLG